MVTINENRSKIEELYDNFDQKKYKLESDENLEINAKPIKIQEQYYALIELKKPAQQNNNQEVDLYDYHIAKYDKNSDEYIRYGVSQEPQMINILKQEQVIYLFNSII